MAASTRHPRRHDDTLLLDNAAQDAGKLLLRLTIGVLVLLHGIAKLRNGVDPIAGMLASHGLPGWLAYLAYVGEVVAPVLVIVGLYTQPAALLISVNMVVAVLLAHRNDIAALNKTGGWAIELQAAYLFGALSVALIGAGRLSLGGARAKWN